MLLFYQIWALCCPKRYVAFDTKNKQKHRDVCCLLLKNHSSQ
uniref:Uncharacterized protein n=1 Tax=Rhizophora mucronata TaxID=61149 RepID=A0A2P2QF46_RHIMU